MINKLMLIFSVLTLILTFRTLSYAKDGAANGFNFTTHAERGLKITNVFADSSSIIGGKDRQIINIDSVVIVYAPEDDYNYGFSPLINTSTFEEFRRALELQNIPLILLPILRSQFAGTTGQQVLEYIRDNVRGDNNLKHPLLFVAAHGGNISGQVTDTSLGIGGHNITYTALRETVLKQTNVAALSIFACHSGSDVLEDIGLLATATSHSSQVSYNDFAPYYYRAWALALTNPQMNVVEIFRRELGNAMAANDRFRACCTPAGECNIGTDPVCPVFDQNRTAYQIRIMPSTLGHLIGIVVRQGSRAKLHLNIDPYIPSASTSVYFPYQVVGRTIGTPAVVDDSRLDDFNLYFSRPEVVYDHIRGLHLRYPNHCDRGFNEEQIVKFNLETCRIYSRGEEITENSESTTENYLSGQDGFFANFLRLCTPLKEFLAANHVSWPKNDVKLCRTCTHVDDRSLVNIGQCYKYGIGTACIDGRIIKDQRSCCRTRGFYFDESNHTCKYDCTREGVAAMSCFSPAVISTITLDKTGQFRWIDSDRLLGIFDDQSPRAAPVDSETILFSSNLLENNLIRPIFQCFINESASVEVPKNNNNSDKQMWNNGVLPILSRQCCLDAGGVWNDPHVAVAASPGIENSDRNERERREDDGKPPVKRSNKSDNSSSPVRQAYCSLPVDSTTVQNNEQTTADADEGKPPRGRRDKP